MRMRLKVLNSFLENKTNLTDILEQKIIIIIVYLSLKNEMSIK